MYHFLNLPRHPQSRSRPPRLTDQEPEVQGDQVIHWRSSDQNEAEPRSKPIPPEWCPRTSELCSLLDVFFLLFPVIQNAQGVPFWLVPGSQSHFLLTFCHHVYTCCQDDHKGITRQVLLHLVRMELSSSGCTGQPRFRHGGTPNHGNPPKCSVRLSGDLPGQCF